MCCQKTSFQIEHTDRPGEFRRVLVSDGGVCLMSGHNGYAAMCLTYRLFDRCGDEPGFEIGGEVDMILWKLLLKNLCLINMISAFGVYVDLLQEQDIGILGTDSLYNVVQIFESPLSGVSDILTSVHKKSHILPQTGIAYIPGHNLETVRDIVLCQWFQGRVVDSLLLWSGLVLKDG